MENFNYTLTNQLTPFSISPPQSPRKSTPTPPISPQKFSQYSSTSYAPSTNSLENSPTKLFAQHGTLSNSPSKPLTNPSVKKRLYHDENLDPTFPELKKACSSHSGQSIRQLLCTLRPTFQDTEWLKHYKDLGPENLTNEQFLEAINEEKNPVKRAEYLETFVRLKLSLLCLSWSILPELDLFKPLQLSEGYYEVITLTFAEHNLLQYYSNPNRDVNIKKLVQECFSTAPFNCFPASRTTQILQDWKSGKPVSLNIGWSTHITSLIILNDIVAYGNRGESHPSFDKAGIIFSRMTEPKNFNDQFISKLTASASFQNTKKQMNFLENGEMTKILGLTRLFHVPTSVQKDDYCTGVVCNLNLHSLIVLSFLKNSTEDLAAEGTIENIIKRAQPEYKDLKRFNRITVLKQFATLLSHADTKAFIGKKDAFKIICHLRTKIISKDKFTSFSNEQQEFLSSFFDNFFHTTALSLKDCVLDFKKNYKIIPSLASKLLQGTPAGTFFLRPGPSFSSFIINYMDHEGKLQSLKIKKIQNNYFLGKQLITHFQDLFNTTLTTPFMDATKLRCI